MQRSRYDEKQTIMILEDDEDLAEGISLSLNSKDLEFILCKTIAEAKGILQQKAFDLLIFDINLPDGSGLELCKEIRRSSQIPIALLTAKDMELDIVKGLECGADDYITKPFSLMVLRARVRALLRRNSGEQKSESEGFFETTGVKQTDFTQGTLKITLKNPLYSEKDITEMQNAIGLDRNQIIDADYDTISNFCKIVAGLIIMLFMIFTSGYLFIYNTLYISISKDIRYYGQLKTVGMTSVQLKRMVYQQAIWNAVIGIPLGLIAAVVAAKIIIPQLLHIVNPILSASDVVSVNVWVFLIAGCFAFLTNLISCKKPAKMAGDCSPIEAIRYTIGTGKGKIRKRESGGIYSMALQNMFRDKKQAVIIFMSFIIALSVFLVINVIIRENDARSILNETYSYDIRFKNETILDNDRKQLITDDMISQIENINGVKSVRRVTSTEAVIPYQEDVYGAYYEELYQSRYSPGNYEDDMKLYQQEPENDLFTARFISVDEKGFEVLNENLGNVLNKNDFENPHQRTDRLSQ